MRNRIDLQVFLLVCFLTEGLTGQQCTLDDTKMCSNFRYSIITNASLSCQECQAQISIKCDENNSSCIIAVKNDTACEHNFTRILSNCNFSPYTTTVTPSTTEAACESKQITITTLSLIALVCVLMLLLVLVTMCWVRTYCTLKKKIREATTVDNRCARESLTSTTDTNNTAGQLCFQNLSYERNSTVYSQSPTPDGAIYDLPFQTATGTMKDEKPQDVKTMERCDNRYKGAEDTVHHGMLERPRAYDNDYWGDEVQTGPVTEYEVPIPLK